jgi:hypothetical protein
MPDLKRLIQYIDKRQAKEGGGIGYSFVKDLPPNIKDTFFALSCLKMIEATSPDHKIVRFLSSYDEFDFYGAYYATKCLRLVGAKVQGQERTIRWSFEGNEWVMPYSVPSTPLIRYLKYEVYGAYGSSIFSSPLSALLKRIELGKPNINPSLIKSLLMLLSNGRLDIMTAYMILEILKAINMQGHPVSIPSTALNGIRQFLSRCTTRRGYVANPTSNSVTLETTYAGHKIARHIGLPDPLGICSFIDELQNENGGFRRTTFGGISTLESCYLALSTIFDDSAPEGLADLKG